MLPRVASWHPPQRVGRSCRATSIPHHDDASYTAVIDDGRSCRSPRARLSARIAGDRFDKSQSRLGAKLLLDGQCTLFCTNAGGAVMSKRGSGEEDVSAFAISLVAFVVVVAGASLGAAVSRRLPKHHLDSESKDMIKVGIGFLATVAAWC